MSQVTICLDDTLDGRVRRQAQAERDSVSKWIAVIIDPVCRDSTNARRL